MGLETLFYIISIIFMLTILSVVTVVGLAVWKIKKKIDQAPRAVSAAASNFLAAKKSELLSTAGLAAVTTILSKLRQKWK